ncbi:MAG TPA: anti-sigma factor [Terriglobia bacterium]|nr:anti-sigma factor [Terriglobia bacterium]
MNPLDDELRSALRKTEPSPDFTQRVMQRIEAEGREQPARWSWWSWLAQAWRVPMLRWAATAVACIALAVGIAEYQRYRRVRAEGEMARAQVMLALEIASNKLNVALAPVQQVEGHQVRRPPSGARGRADSKAQPPR